MTPYYYFLIILFSFTTVSLAKGKDPTYIYTGIHNPSLDLSIDNQGAETIGDDEIKDVHYVPKDPLIISLGAAYGGFSGSLSTDIPEPDDVEKLDYSDYRFSYFADAWGIDGQYTSFARFRLDAVLNLDESVLDEEDRLRGDLEIEARAVNTYWFPLRWRWDFDPSLDPAHEKKTNGLGAGLIGSFHSTAIDSTRGLVPSDYRDDFGREGAIESGTFTGANLQLALGGTLSIWRFYGSLLFAAGHGYQQLDYDTQRERVQGVGVSDTQIIHGVAGYVGPRFFTSLEYREDSPTFLMKTVSLSTTRSELVYKFGVKFK